MADNGLNNGNGFRRFESHVTWLWRLIVGVVLTAILGGGGWLYTDMLAEVRRLDTTQRERGERLRALEERTGMNQATLNEIALDLKKVREDVAAIKARRQ